ncbi:S1 RNA-binding domain-containing protein [Phormidesmis sp. 146-12]
MNKSTQSRSNDAAFSMDDFAKALEQHDYQFAKGQIVQGRVFSYESGGALIDIGGKSPAFLPAQEASVCEISDVSTVLPTDEDRDFLIIREQDENGQVTLSLRQLEIKKVWDSLADMQANNQSVQVRVTGTNKGGVTVDLQGLRGFIPRSHLVERENLDALKGQTLTATFLEADRDRNKLVLSNRLAARAANFSQLQVGQLIEGKVASLKPFGAFIEFDGSTGLLHINQISKNYIASLPSLLEVGQVIKAMIVDLDEGRGRVSLSTKVLENFPGEMTENMAQVMEEAESRSDRARSNL